MGPGGPAERTPSQEIDDEVSTENFSNSVVTRLGRKGTANERKPFQAVGSWALILFLAALAGASAAVAADSTASIQGVFPYDSRGRARRYLRFQQPELLRLVPGDKATSAGRALPRILLAGADVFERRALHPDLLQRNDGPRRVEAREGRNGAQDAVSEPSSPADRKRSRTRSSRTRIEASAGSFNPGTRSREQGTLRSDDVPR